MSSIYVGDPSRVNRDVLEKTKELPNDFFVFAEFTIGRNVDWLIIRPTQLSTLILTEVKVVARPIQGDVNGPWEQLNEAGVWEELPARGKDINYYWQAVNTANALAEWLWNNQARYLEGGEIRPVEQFRVWPDLLLLSPPGVTHRLPLGPPNRFGRWWYNLDQWLNHVRDWQPRSGLALTPREVANLAETLGLEQVWEGDRRDSVAGNHQSPAAADALAGFVTWMRDLDARLRRLEERVAALSSRAGVSPSSPPAPRPLPQSRPLTEQEKQAITGAVAQIRLLGRSRALPNVLDAVNARLGYDLKERGYDGFGTARAMFDQARLEGIIKYGPLSGPNPTIYLPDETIPTT